MTEREPIKIPDDFEEDASLYGGAELAEKIAMEQVREGKPVTVLITNVPIEKTETKDDEQK